MTQKSFAGLPTPAYVVRSALPSNSWASYLSCS